MGNVLDERATPVRRMHAMIDQRRSGIGSRFVRIVFVALFASLLATGGTMAAPDTAVAGSPIYQPMGCRGSCY